MFTIRINSSMMFVVMATITAIHASMASFNTAIRHGQSDNQFNQTYALHYPELTIIKVDQEDKLDGDNPELTKPNIEDVKKNSNVNTKNNDKLQPLLEQAFLKLDELQTLQDEVNALTTNKTKLPSVNEANFQTKETSRLSDFFFKHYLLSNATTSVNSAIMQRFGTKRVELNNIKHLTRSRREYTCSQTRRQRSICTWTFDYTTNYTLVPPTVRQLSCAGSRSQFGHLLIQCEQLYEIRTFRIRGCHQEPGNDCHVRKEVKSGCLATLPCLIDA